MAKRSRRANHRLVKIHYSYTVEEVARLFGIHKNTVREWLRHGLSTIDKRRPLLILGKELFRFLKSRRDSAKRPCKPGELYCVKCRQSREPAGGMTEFKPLADPIGNLVGICPVCNSMMYRRANRLRLEARSAVAETHISQSGHPSLNSDFRLSAPDYANAQPRE